MSLKRHFSWNLFGSCTPMLVGVFSIPILIEKLGMEKFGLLTLIWTLIGYFSLFDFGLGRALTQIVSKKQGDDESVSLFSSLGLILTFYMGCVGGVGVFLSSFLIHSGVFGISSVYVEDVRNALVIAAFGIPLTTLTSGCRGVLEGKFKFRESNFLRLYLGIGNFILPVLSVYFVNSDLSSITFSLVLVRTIILFASIRVVSENVSLKYISFKKSLDETKYLLNFGSWMTLSNIISPLMVTADRFLVSSVIGVSLLAYYTVPFEVIIRFLIIPAALTGAFFPHISKELSENIVSAKRMYMDKYKIILFVMLGGLISTLLFSKVLLGVWVGEEFSNKSWYIADILMLGVFFNGIAQMPHSVIQATGNSKSIALAHLIELLVYIPLLYFVVIYSGVIGAAIAWAARAILDWAIMSYLCKCNVFNIEKAVSEIKN
ncbi:Polysaccharide biosynthesis protein [Marinomonas spartinae]|uniref:flippase n=1 Tax=Marinomonas spartinae TaxID=1792290 RepID=UPI000808F1A9|nr:flippase [Marinomonas spartinae]SBS40422.1 Polysaccharide biosynthesis protein [Marinomonas spartinae]